MSLLDDLPLKEKYHSTKQLYAAADHAFKQNAINCWIAACIYMLVLVLSGHQLYTNSHLQATSDDMFAQ